MKALKVDGTPLSEIKRLVDHWLQKYDWRLHEKQLNILPQYIVPISVNDFGTLNIHFVHQQSSRSNAIPLLFCHGWPDHFAEVTNILPLLTEPPADQQAFHVVAPSTPRFTFSTNPSLKGFNVGKIAETFNKLMLILNTLRKAEIGDLQL